MSHAQNDSNASSADNNDSYVNSNSSSATSTQDGLLNNGYINSSDYAEQLSYADPTECENNFVQPVEVADINQLVSNSYTNTEIVNKGQYGQPTQIVQHSNIPVMVSQDATVSIAEYPQSPSVLPEHLFSLPTLEKDPSTYKLEINVRADNKNSFFANNTLFTKLKKPVCFEVKYLRKFAGENLFLRMMVVFSDDSDIHLPVKRCANHFSIDGQHHVLTSTNNGAERVGKGHSGFIDRFAVVVPLPFIQQELIYCEFGCNNSCNGIAKRPTAISFTLESEYFQRHATTHIPFKVSENPKRDSGFLKQQRQQDNSGKKRLKVEPENTETVGAAADATPADELMAMMRDVSELPYKTIHRVMRSMHDTVKGEMEKRSCDENVQQFQKSLASIQQMETMYREKTKATFGQQKPQ